MRPPPPVSEAPRFPVIAGLALLAAGVTLARALKVDVSALYLTMAVNRGEVWRLLTCALPHANVFHLTFNLYWLWVFGSLIEEEFGHARCLALIAFLAAGSSAAEFAVLEGGIGLSGVVYGFFGFLWALSRYSPRFAGTVDSRTAVVFVVWFFLCIATTVAGVWPIANVAHGAGAVLGGLAGLAAAGPRVPRPRRLAAAAGAVALAAVCLAGATAGRPYLNFSSRRGQAEARLGYEALETHRDHEALVWCLDSVRMQPASASNWYNLGIAWDRVGDHGRAAAAFERASRLSPDSEEFRKAFEGHKG